MMAEGQNPKIGIIADSSLQRYIISSAVRQMGYDVTVNTGPENAHEDMLQSHETQQDIDAWLVGLEDENQWSEFVDTLFDVCETPILLGDGKVPSHTHPVYPRWARRIYSKLKDIVGDPVVEDQSAKIKALLEKESQATAIPLPAEIARREGLEAADRVWVLGASLGGPAAVKEFLDCLPEGLPIGFVYAQHIDAGFQKTLVQVLGRHNKSRMCVAEEGMPVHNGDVVVAPVEHVIDFDEHQRIKFVKEDWPGPYSPSIDKMMENTMKAFSADSGAILFSGMGNDGAIAGPSMVERGAPVWVQKSDTCANSSMPDSVAATGCSSYVGSPNQLAWQLIEYLKKIS